MDPRKIEHFKQRLIEEKNQVLQTLERMKEHKPERSSIREYTEELSAYDNHPADLGTETFMMTMQDNLETHHKYRIAEIDRALDKIREGTYGLCKVCGKEIPDERLEIVPDANVCMECAEDKIPIEELMDYRPVEEDPLTPPFERTNKDKDDFTGFDGEDAYQKVAKFNEIGNDPSFSGGDYIGVFDAFEPGTVEGIEDATEDEYMEQLPDDEEDNPLTSKKKNYGKKS